MKPSLLYQDDSNGAIDQRVEYVPDLVIPHGFFTDPRLSGITEFERMKVLRIVYIAQKCGDGLNVRMRLKTLLHEINVGVKRWTNKFLPVLVADGVLICEVEENEDPGFVFVTIHLSDWLRIGGNNLQQQNDSQPLYDESANADRFYSGNGRHYSESKEATRKREQRQKNGTSSGTMSHFPTDDSGQMSGSEVGHSHEMSHQMSHEQAEMSHFQAPIGTHVGARPSDRSIDDRLIEEDRLIDGGDQIDRSIDLTRGTDLPPAEEAKIPVKITEHQPVPRLKLPPHLQPIYDDEAHWTDAEVRVAIARMQSAIKRKADKGEEEIQEELAYLKTTLASVRTKAQNTHAKAQDAQERMSLLSIETGMPAGPVQRVADSPPAFQTRASSPPPKTTMRDLAAENMERLKRLGLVP